MNLKRFFQNDSGKLVIYQHPNVLLTAWIILQILGIFIHTPSITILAKMVLFAWAYEEITAGQSPFRRVLGSVILLFIIIQTIIHG